MTIENTGEWPYVSAREKIIHTIYLNDNGDIK